MYVRGINVLWTFKFEFELEVGPSTYNSSSRLERIHPSTEVATTPDKASTTPGTNWEWPLEEAKAGHTLHLFLNWRQKTGRYTFPNIYPSVSHSIMLTRLQTICPQSIMYAVVVRSLSTTVYAPIAA